MALDQAVQAPQSGDQISPISYAQVFPNLIKITPEERAQLPKATQAETPVDTVKLMNEWHSAYDKAKTGWVRGPSVQELADCLRREDLTDGERKALITMRDNYKDLSSLDGAQIDFSKQDLEHFGVLLKNTDRDIKFYDKGQKFLAQNKEKLDINHDGVLDWSEIDKARTNPDFGEDVQDTIKYLSDRYSRNLAHKRYESTGSLFAHYGKQIVPDEDYQPGHLAKVIDKTQELAYAYKVSDELRILGTGAGFGVGYAVSKYFNFGMLGMATTIVGTTTLMHQATAEVAKWLGPIQQNSDEERIRRLMTKVANFKY